jgi:hypothetical protein
VTTDSSALPSAAEGGFWQSWQTFWFAPIPSLGLHWVRFLAGLLFLAWLVPLTGERHALFGQAGWLDRTALLEAARLGDNVAVRPASWSLVYLGGTNPVLLDALWWSSLAVLTLFTLGIWTRVTAVLTWVIVVSFQANPALAYDADLLLAVLAFYLMVGYLFLGQWSGDLSLAKRLLGPRGTSVFAALRRRDTQEAQPSHAANFALRLLQVHFALAVVASAFHKLQFGDWWSGVAYWYPLHPPFEMDAQKLQAAKASTAGTLFFLSLAQYVALAWLLAFPVFAFRRRWRWLLLLGAVGAWLGIFYIYRLPIFGPLYVICCLSYLTPGEWRWLSGGLYSLVQRRAERGPAIAGEKRARVKTSP